MLKKLMKFANCVNLIKLFFFITVEEIKKSRVFLLAKLFQLIIIFVSKIMAYQRGLHLSGTLLEWYST